MIRTRSDRKRKMKRRKIKKAPLRVQTTKRYLHRFLKRCTLDEEQKFSLKKNSRMLILKRK